MITEVRDKKARPSRIGRVMFPKDRRLHFFMGYTKCEHCKADLKVLTDPQESRSIAKAFGYSKPTWKARFARMIQKWVSDV